MANPHANVTHWQTSADNFAKIKAAADAIVANPASTPDEVADAKDTSAAMTKNLARLLSKYGVSPAAV